MEIDEEPEIKKSHVKPGTKTGTKTPNPKSVSQKKTPTKNISKTLPSDDDYNYDADAWTSESEKDQVMKASTQIPRERKTNLQRRSKTEGRRTKPEAKTQTPLSLPPSKRKHKSTKPAPTSEDNEDVPLAIELTSKELPTHWPAALCLYRLPSQHVDAILSLFNKIKALTDSGGPTAKAPGFGSAFGSEVPLRGWPEAIDWNEARDRTFKMKDCIVDFFPIVQSQTHQEKLEQELFSTLHTVITEGNNHEQFDYDELASSNYLSLDDFIRFFLVHAVATFMILPGFDDPMTHCWKDQIATSMVNSFPPKTSQNPVSTRYTINILWRSNLHRQIETQNWILLLRATENRFKLTALQIHIPPAAVVEEEITLDVFRLPAKKAVNYDPNQGPKPGVINPLSRGFGCMFTVARLEIGTGVTIEAILRPFSTNSEWFNKITCHWNYAGDFMSSGEFLCALRCFEALKILLSRNRAFNAEIREFNYIHQQGHIYITCTLNALKIPEDQARLRASGTARSLRIYLDLAHLHLTLGCERDQTAIQPSPAPYAYAYAIRKRRTLLRRVVEEAVSVPVVGVGLGIRHHGDALNSRARLLPQFDGGVRRMGVREDKERRQCMGE
ncbi:hypothetical protein B0H13DRAFT_1921508 [Mycena leptocephala]|nr:hypothetical protein B0H13DRAFT_1921508 [Mycena leptocephala]